MIVLQLTFRRKSLSVTLTLTDASFSAVIQFELLKSLLEKICRFEVFDYWSSWNVWDTHSTGAVCVCVVLKHEMTECVSWSMCDSLSATHPADESLIVFTLYLLMNLKCSYGEDRASLCVCTTISSLIHYFWQFWCSGVSGGSAEWLCFHRTAAWTFISLQCWKVTFIFINILLFCLTIMTEYIDMRSSFKIILLSMLQFSFKDNNNFKRLEQDETHHQLQYSKQNSSSF